MKDITKEMICDVRYIEDVIAKFATPKEELIRCGNCKHWYPDADTGMACEFTNLGQPSNGFCNWADKK